MTRRIRARTPLTRFVLPSLALASIALTVPEVAASGISTARFGGEHGHPTTENPTAVYYNPGAIALSKGTHIFVDGLIAFRGISYTRPDSAVDPQGGIDGNPNTSLDEANGANNGTAKLFNVVGAPMLAVTSDFGTDIVWGGFSVSVPFGGGSTWKKNDAFKDNPDFPGAYDGVQRWHAIDGELRSYYITGALAFKIKAAKMTIGVSGSAIRSSIDSIRARNTEGHDNLVTVDPFSGEYGLKEGRSWLQAQGWQGGFAAGVTFEPLDNKLWIGASYTSQPNVSGGMTLKGTLTNLLGSAGKSTTDILFTQSLPDIVRLGFRIRPIPKLEVRLFADYTRWSVMDKQCVMIQQRTGTNPDTGMPYDDPTPRCDFDNPENAIDNPEEFGGIGDGVVAVTQHLPRYWKDAGGVRLGVGYFFLDNLEAYVGLGYDSSAIPVEMVDPSLFDMDKVGVSLGTLWQAHKRVAMGVTITQIIYVKLDTEGRSNFDDFQSPTRQPSADGVYKQWLTVGNLYLDISF